jgi:hypothetical protein
MPGGWGGYQKPKKSKQQVALERRRELGNKFFTPIDELQHLAATARVKVKRLPPAPHPNDVAPRESDAPITGPCQDHVDYFRAWREAGRPRGKVIAAGPTERQKKLAAARAHYEQKKAKKAEVKAEKVMSCGQRLSCATHGYVGSPGNTARHRKKHVGCVIKEA